MKKTIFSFLTAAGLLFAGCHQPDELLPSAFFIFLALFTALLIAELSIMFRQIKIGPENEKQ